MKIESELEGQGIRTFQITDVFVKFLKKVGPQPSSDLEEEIYEKLVKSNPPNMSSLELRRIDVSPEDLPSGSVFEYYWSVETSHDELTEVFETIAKIEMQYKSVIGRLIERSLEGNAIDIDKKVWRRR